MGIGRSRPLFIVALALGSAACATSGSATAPSPVAAESLIADRLYFGRDVPGGGEVSDADWQAFVDSVITPRFPRGLTIWRAEGQWRDSLGVTEHESVMVLEVLHPRDAAVEDALEEIAREYKRRFRQEAVMRATTPAITRFYD